MCNCVVQHDPDRTNNDRQHHQQSENKGHHIPARFPCFTDMHEEEELDHKLKCRGSKNNSHSSSSVQYVVQHHYQRNDGQNDGQNEADDIGLHGTMLFMAM